MTEQQKLRELLENSSHIVFFGGAGVSTESGVPDFRSEDGLYGSKQAKTYPYPPETMLSHSFFKRYTEQFFEYYFDRMVYPQAKPNAAHYALAELEAQGKLSAVVTQNIDGLHQQAGSKRVYERAAQPLRPVRRFLFARADAGVQGQGCSALLLRRGHQAGCSAV